MFRGREITYTAFGRRLLDRMAEDMAPLAAIEREPRLEGRNMFMILAPRERPTGPPKFSSLHKEHKEQEEHKEHLKDHKDHADHKNDAPAARVEDDDDADDAELDDEVEIDQIETKEPTSA
jgi:hypothetical protein